MCLGFFPPILVCIQTLSQRLSFNCSIVIWTPHTCKKQLRLLAKMLFACFTPEGRAVLSVHRESGCDRAPGCGRRAGYETCKSRKWLSWLAQQMAPCSEPAPLSAPHGRHLPAAPFQKKKKKIQSSLVEKYFFSHNQNIFLNDLMPCFFIHSLCLPSLSFRCSLSFSPSTRPPCSATAAQLICAAN